MVGDVDAEPKATRSGALRSWRVVFGAVCVWTVLASSVGCSRDPGQIEVELCGDVSVPDDIDAVRVIFLDDEREETQSGVRELLLCPQDELLLLPQTFGFTEVEGDVTIQVQGLKDGVEVGTYERRVMLEPMRATATIRMALTRDCLGVQCSLGQTCQGGVCALTQRGPWMSTGDNEVVGCDSRIDPVVDADMGTEPEPEPEVDMGMGGEGGPIYCDPEEAL